MLVEDGIDEAAPPMITVLDAAGSVPSGLRLSASPMLATRLVTETGALREPVVASLDGVQGRWKSRVPDTSVLRAIWPGVRLIP
ncbi:MAG: hypothetical protein QM677_00820 [Microbacterium sp.]